VLLVVGLALTAAFLFALAASLQQHEAHQANRAIEQRLASSAHPDAGAASRRRGLLLALANQLPRSRLWRLGWGINLGGFIAQAAALYVGSVALVQPLLVTQLIFALPLATAWLRQWPSRRAWLSAATICAGVILFLGASGGSVLGGEADRDRIVLSALCIAGAVVLLTRLAVRWPSVQVALVAVAAGLCLAMSAVLMKLTAEDLVERGVAATAVDWPGYTLAISAFSGVFLAQWAFAAGSLPTAIAAITITNPVASYLIGILAFHVAPAARPARVAGVVLAGLLISAGVIGLARSPIVPAPTGPRIRESEAGSGRSGVC
jgi:drug/metabolite transporter (DMT)-like permease